MKRPTKDELWKSIVEDLFEDFMYYFFEKEAKQIDFERGYTFLDKELNTILPESETRNRRADKLAKVWLKNGEEKWMLIHIEVQGYWDDNFAHRVYSSHYRIRDKYGKPVAVFAIYTDKYPHYHPKEFREECLSTISLLQFATYKLLDHPPQENSNNENPFSIVMEVVWYEIMRQNKKITEEEYLEVGKKIVWKLARGGYPREKIHNIMQFTKYYFPFEKPENFIKFEEVINIVLENKKDMGILELVAKYERENIRDEARFEMIKNGLEAGIPVEHLSKITKLSVEELNAIVKEQGWDMDSLNMKK